MWSFCCQIGIAWNTPSVVITYLEGDEEGPQKEIVFNEAYWSSSMESLLGAIMHQVKSLMEELQSFEGE